MLGTQLPLRSFIYVAAYVSIWLSIGVHRWLKGFSEMSDVVDGGGGDLSFRVIKKYNPITIPMRATSKIIKVII